MPRLPLVLVLTAVASLGFLTTACAERTQTEEAPAPSVPIEPPATVAAISSSARPFNGLKLQRMNDLRRPMVARPPASLVGAPAVTAAPDASTK
jgi:hypothetical protein